MVVFFGLQHLLFLLHGVGKCFVSIFRLIMSCQPNIISSFGRFGLISISISCCISFSVTLSFVFPVMSIFLLFASFMLYELGVTGVIFSLSCFAMVVLMALVVAPESGRACIMFVVCPCFVVRIILGVVGSVLLFLLLFFMCIMLPYVLIFVMYSAMFSCGCCFVSWFVIIVFICCCWLFCCVISCCCCC